MAGARCDGENSEGQVTSLPGCGHARKCELHLHLPGRCSQEETLPGLKPITGLHLCGNRLARDANCGGERRLDEWTIITVRSDPDVIFHDLSPLVFTIRGLGHRGRLLFLRS